MTSHANPNKVMDRRSMLALAAMQGILAGAGVSAASVTSGCSRSENAIVAAPMETTSASSSVPPPPTVVKGVSPPMRAEKPPARIAKDCCRGKNDCKGKSGCANAKNECKGKNDCKGLGTACDDSDEAPPNQGKAACGARG